MPKPRVTFDDVRRMAVALPDVEEGTMYGSPAFKLRGKLLACMAINRSAEPDTLAVMIDMQQRDAMVDEDPRTYYLTDHYVDYPVVLVRLTRVDPVALHDLLGAAWRFVSATASRPRRAARRPTPRATKR